MLYVQENGNEKTLKQFDSVYPEFFRVESNIQVPHRARVIVGKFNIDDLVEHNKICHRNHIFELAVECHFFMLRE